MFVPNRIPHPSHCPSPHLYLHPNPHNPRYTHKLHYAHYTHGLDCAPQTKQAPRTHGSQGAYSVKSTQGIPSTQISQGAQRIGRVAWGVVRRRPV
jgi:hypothetical protein